MNRTLTAATGENKTNNKNEKKEKKEKKTPNYAGKAQSKIKVGRSTVTDGNYWKRVIQEDLAKPTEVRKASQLMAEGYMSQIDFHIAPVQQKTDALDMKCVEGIKDEAVLKPFVDDLSKAIDSYGIAIKAIKTLYVSWWNDSL
ncbi:hypothetical protein AK812_SmicGene47597 [Symbiodinium microadriaticum]|uniref:Uncharacterized protein n=1 Tax=Symbiodinium microadriaticum TaxID=2951 RepID=A0A1Q9BRE3_SYMMI|nr:hypothetical protein AK812_SmicGene47597 [Symbiodinium microadriaticum]